MCRVIGKIQLLLVINFSLSLLARDRMGIASKSTANAIEYFQPSW